MNADTKHELALAAWEGAQKAADDLEPACEMEDFTLKDADKVLVALRKATAKAQELKNQMAGNPPARCD